MAAVLHELAIGDIQGSPFNPRKEFGEDELADLAKSIQELGVQQPIVVRNCDYAERTAPFEVVMGERRLRAAKSAGLSTIPAIVRDDITDAQLLELALVENLQRKDLNPIEEARAFKQLTEIGGYSQTDLGKKLGISQEKISNRIRLLGLPERVQIQIEEGSLSASHGMALLAKDVSAETREALADLAISNDIGSKALESGTAIGDNEDDLAEMLKAGYATALDGQWDFDINEICEQCPFNAMVKDKWGDDWYCLKPEHAKELQAAYEADQKVRTAAAQAKNAPETAADPDGLPTWPDGVVDKSKMRWDTYTDIYSDNCKACTEACECRRQGRYNETGTIQQICIAPKHRQALVAKETRIKNDARKKETLDTLRLARVHLDGLADIGAASDAEYGLLCALLLGGADKPSSKVVQDVRQARYAAHISAAVHADLPKTAYALSQAQPVMALRFVLDCYLQHEAIKRCENDYNRLVVAPLLLKNAPKQPEPDPAQITIDDVLHVVDTPTEAAAAVDAEREGDAPPPFEEEIVIPEPPAVYDGQPCADCKQPMKLGHIYFMEDDTAICKDCCGKRAEFLRAEKKTATEAANIEPVPEPPHDEVEKATPVIVGQTWQSKKDETNQVMIQQREDANPPSWTVQKLYDDNRGPNHYEITEEKLRERYTPVMVEDG